MGLLGTGCVMKDLCTIELSHCYMMEQFFSIKSNFSGNRRAQTEANITDNQEIIERSLSVASDLLKGVYSRFDRPDRSHWRLMTNSRGYPNGPLLAKSSTRKSFGAMRTRLLHHLTRNLDRLSGEEGAWRGGQRKKTPLLTCTL